MRMGREAEARTVLKEAFDADPFHVRVKNSLDVLDVAGCHAARTAPHFLIRYDKADARLIPYLARAPGNRLRRAAPAVRLRAAGPDAGGDLPRVAGQSGHAWFMRG